MERWPRLMREVHGCDYQVPTEISAGILLLVLLPTMRVFLTLMLYARRRGFLKAVVALLVLLERLISVGGGVG